MTADSPIVLLHGATSSAKVWLLTGEPAAPSGRTDLINDERLTHYFNLT